MGINLCPLLYYRRSLNSSLIMTETKDNIVDRDELQASLIHQLIDDIDTKTMMSMLYDYIDESYDKYSVDELIEEVQEYYPHLLE